MATPEQSSQKQEFTEAPSGIDVEGLVQEWLADPDMDMLHISEQLDNGELTTADLQEMERILTEEEDQEDQRVADLHKEIGDLLKTEKTQDVMIVDEYQELMGQDPRASFQFFHEQVQKYLKKGDDYVSGLFFLEEFKDIPEIQEDLKNDLVRIAKLAPLVLAAYLPVLEDWNPANVKSARFDVYRELFKGRDPADLALKVFENASSSHLGFNRVVAVRDAAKEAGYGMDERKVAEYVEKYILERPNGKSYYPFVDFKEQMDLADGAQIQIDKTKLQKEANTILARKISVDPELLPTWKIQGSLQSLKEAKDQGVAIDTALFSGVLNQNLLGYIEQYPVARLLGASLVGVLEGAKELSLSLNISMLKGALTERINTPKDEKELLETLFNLDSLIKRLKDEGFDLHYEDIKAKLEQDSRVDGKTRGELDARAVELFVKECEVADDSVRLPKDALLDNSDVKKALMDLAIRKPEKMLFGSGLLLVFGVDAKKHEKFTKELRFHVLYSVSYMSGGVNNFIVKYLEAQDKTVYSSGLSNALSSLKEVLELADKYNIFYDRKVLSENVNQIVWDVLDREDSVRDWFFGYDELYVKLDEAGLGLPAKSEELQKHFTLLAQKHVEPRTSQDPEDWFSELPEIHDKAGERGIMYDGVALHEQINAILVEPMDRDGEIKRYLALPNIQATLDKAGISLDEATLKRIKFFSRYMEQ
ncbi:MAG: hypothetical protein WC846_02965 [Candidatus Gracilibacteria bacterium]|jgi:hypothetical protein